MADFCQRVPQGLAHPAFAQKRQLVELLIDCVVVTNEEVEIRYVILPAPAVSTSVFVICGKTLSIPHRHRALCTTVHALGTSATGSLVSQSHSSGSSPLGGRCSWS